MGVGVGVGTRVGVGVSVEVGVGLGVGLGLAVAVGVAVGLAVAVGAGVGVGLGVRVAVGTGVGLAVGVAVAVGVGVGVGAALLHESASRDRETETSETTTKHFQHMMPTSYCPRKASPVLRTGPQLSAPPALPDLNVREVTRFTGQDQPAYCKVNITTWRTAKSRTTSALYIEYGAGRDPPRGHSAAGQRGKRGTQARGTGELRLVVGHYGIMAGNLPIQRGDRVRVARLDPTEVELVQEHTGCFLGLIGVVNNEPVWLGPDPKAGPPGKSKCHLRSI